jgi:hypothetical protein
MDLLKSYFKGDVPAKELRRRTREIVSQHFTRSNEFYSLVVSAFMVLLMQPLRRRRIPNKVRGSC